MCEILTDERIKQILVAFYNRVRSDASLSQPFAVVEDWDEHITRLTDFWSSLMLTTGRYKGNPLSMHLVHIDKIEPAMFARWLELWKQTTDELVPPDVALQMQAKAGRVAARFSQAMFGASAQPEPALAGVSPYRVTATFSENSVPAPLLRSHSLREGAWGLIKVEEGTLRYLEGDTKIDLGSHMPGVIPPCTPHHLELVGPVKFRLEFYDRPPVQN